MSDKEKADLDVVTAAEYFDTVQKSAHADKIDNWTRDMLEYTKKMRDIADTMSEGYQNYLSEMKRKISACEESAAGVEAERLWRVWVGENDRSATGS